MPKVFVISSIWDHNYHHLLIDVLPRLVRYLPYLRQHPDIKLHFRRSERYSMPAVAIRAVAMKKRVLRLLGIEYERIISGPVIAGEMLLPRSMVCNLPVVNALEVRVLVKYLLASAQVMDRDKSPLAHYPYTLVNGRVNSEASESTSKHPRVSSKPIHQRSKVCIRLMLNLVNS